MPTKKKVKDESATTTPAVDAPAPTQTTEPEASEAPTESETPAATDTQPEQQSDAKPEPAAIPAAAQAELDQNADQIAHLANAVYHTIRFLVARFPGYASGGTEDIDLHTAKAHIAAVNELEFVDFS